MRLIKFILFIIICLEFNMSFGQDFIFSQVHNNRLFQNPAYTGYENGKNRLSILHRAQYITPGPYSLNTLTFDKRLCKPKDLGLGLLVSNEEQGDGFLRTLFVGGSIGFHKKLTDAVNIHAGMQLSGINQYVSWSKFIFPDQINSYGIDPNLVSSNAGLNNNQGVIGADWNVGLLFECKQKINNQKGEEERNIFIIGGSWYHLNKPNIGLIDHSYQLPFRTNLHADYTFLVSKDEMNLNFAWIQQDNLNFQTYNFNANYIINEKLNGGLGLRDNLNNYIGKNIFFILFNIGFKVDLNNTANKFGFSYDLPIGSYVGPAGIFEFSYSLDFDTKCKKKKDIKCHRM
jgi:type IX secretion system PorP/SprF family membrane protein